MPKNLDIGSMMMCTSIMNRSAMLGEAAVAALQFCLAGPGVIPCGPTEDRVLAKPDDEEEQPRWVTPRWE